ncbi:MAG: CHAD domain-containing protein [Pleurocapsa minor HA4230-MV1]|jgi:CHAD domain-containing protein|nr:CHAD domain-containing protein [Pleurocapsa minor HA4230-MV1]
MSKRSLKTTEKNSVVAVKKLAEQAIAKHSRLIFKHEAGVFKDKDPEDLHQMRVGLRRLRSAIASLAWAMNLPEIVTVKKLGKIGHSLGALRDLDVLLEVLSNNYRPLLSDKEQKILDKAIKSLGKRRNDKLKQVHKTLNSKLYLELKQELKDWLKRPKYKVSGDYSLNFVLPDLLLPSVSEFLLHPGWLVGVELKEGKIEFPTVDNMEAIDRLLELEATFLHDLRKSAKKTRYSLELFAQFYGKSYHDYLKRIEAVQEILGQIQDIHVLIEVLEKVLRSPIAEKMPELADLLLRTRYQKWLEWQILQKQFLEVQTRQKLRQEIQAVLNSQKLTNNH